MRKHFAMNGAASQHAVAAGPDSGAAEAAAVVNAAPDEHKADVAAAAVHAMAAAKDVDVATAAVKAAPDAPKADLAAAAVNAASDENKADVAAAAIGAVPNGQKADTITSVINNAPEHVTRRVADQLMPDQTMANKIWLRIVTTFALVLGATTLALVGAIFVGFWRKVDATNVQILLTVFTTSGGILAGFISGRASTSKARG
jgi:hypothetical protein